MASLMFVAFVPVLVLARAPLVGQEPAPAQPAPSPVVVEGKLGQALDEHVAALAALGFDGSVLVAKDGKTILCKGYGLARREERIANEPDTLFDIGSLTKQFTAAAILKLEELGKLETSDRLSKYVGEVPRDKAAITLHHLLTQTSGLPREVPIDGNTAEREDLIATALATKLRSKPGAEFRYANANYDLLGAVVEIVSKQRFEDFVKEQLFVPAELRRTTFLQDASVDAGHTAYGVESRAVFRAEKGWYSWGLRGAGGVLSSVVELERWWRALDGGKVLSAKAKKKLFEPELMGYACGWWVREHDELGPWIEHGGSTRGFESCLSAYPEHALLVIVLSNQRETCKPTAASLARAALGLRGAKPPVGVALAPEKLEQCAGTFAAGKNGEVEVHAIGARLALRLSPEAVVLLAAGREAKSLSRDPELAQKIDKILACMRAGDASGLEGLVTTEWPGWNETLVKQWREWAAERGTYERHEVLGTERESDLLKAFVSLVFDSGILVVAMSFRDELFSSYALDAGVPSGPVFVAKSENEFAWLDPGSRGSDSCELLLERDAKGRVTELTVRVRLDTLKAKRKK